MVDPISNSPFEGADTVPTTAEPSQAGDSATTDSPTAVPVQRPAEAEGDDEHSPADRRKQRVREQIMAAAEAVFASEGPSGLSMRRLAERIDYSPAAIYKYFDSKNALIEAMREVFFERLLARIVNAMDDANFFACVQTCMRAYIECGMERPNHYRIAFTHEDEGAGTPAVISPDTKAHEAEQHLQGIIARGVELGEFEPVDPALAAKSVWSSLHGMTLLLVEMPEFPQKMEGSEHLTRDAVIDFHTRAVARSLRPL